MRSVALVAVALAAAACHETSSAAKPRTCIEAWNSPANHANRARVLSYDGPTFRVEVSRWITTHSSPEFTGTGCSFLFYNWKEYVSFSLAWENDDDARWEDALTQTGRRRPEQRFKGPNARVTGDGTLLAGGSALSARRALRTCGKRVINDVWEDNDIDRRYPAGCYASALRSLEVVRSESPSLENARAAISWQLKASFRDRR